METGSAATPAEDCLIRGASPGDCLLPAPGGRGPAGRHIGDPRTPRRITLTTFADLGVRAETVAALAELNITEPFAIQTLAIPLALQGQDVIGQARTGTGKTLAFGVPLLQRLELPGPGRPQALVVVPTRELCVQVAGDLARAGANRHARVLAVYGGRSYEPQVAALAGGIDLVVGTPGRLLDLARQGALRLGEVRGLVLDEADEMLDLGFLPDVERILALLPGERQTMLFSATMPGPVVTLARRYLRQPVHLRAEAPEESPTVPDTRQHVFRAHALDKPELLARVLQADGRGLSMVFCRTKRTAARVAEELATRGFAAAAVHGDLGQAQREQALRAFRTGKIDVLVATDVAARGIDVAGVTHVINYQCPEDEKVYLHRIGRTGRAGGSGTAVTLVDWDDIARWQMINTALSLPFDNPPETYSTSEHLREALDIPSGAGGRLPRDRRTRAGLQAEQIEDLGETGRTRSRPAAESPGRRRQRTRGGRRAGSAHGGADGAGPRRLVDTAAGGAPAAATGADRGSAAADAVGAPGRRRSRRRGRRRPAGSAPESAEPSRTAV